MAEQEQNYLTIIGDLVGSRRLEAKERGEVQKRFKSVLEKINSDFRSEIASLFLITIGDEAQGILNRPNRCYDILRQIQIELAPTEIVFGIGYGPLTTELGEYAVGSDGPAFHLAREALSEAKEDRKAYGKSILREASLHSGSCLRDTIINAMFLSLSVLKSNWTAKQEAILNLLEQGVNSTEVAKMLKIPLSNVSRTIENTRFREYEILVHSVQKIIQEHFDELS